jgi:formamidopyrimidine-DNA glycosylase
MDLSGGESLLSHLGMSGRWLFFETPPRARLAHVHARIRFEDGSELWFQDPRRFGLLQMIETARAYEDPALALLGPDPVLEPPAPSQLLELGRGSRAPIKSFLMDQRRIAGVGNIYASEILYRAHIHPARPTSSLTLAEWATVSRATRAVMKAAIKRMGTTFSTYRTLWNEPGSYGDQLRVYERAGQSCRNCGGPIQRLVQSNRSTFLCPRCQPRTWKRAGRPPVRRRGRSI